jgi:hypothetical protein
MSAGRPAGRSQPSTQTLRRRTMAARGVIRRVEPRGADNPPENASPQTYGDFCVPGNENPPQTGRAGTFGGFAPRARRRRCAVAPKRAQPGCALGPNRAQSGCAPRAQPRAAAILPHQPLRGSSPQRARRETATPGTRRAPKLRRRPRHSAPGASAPGAPTTTRTPPLATASGSHPIRWSHSAAPPRTAADATP